jgi:putative ABC transport system permease protein
MKGLWTLVWHSAWNRRFVLGLICLSMALSMFMLLSIERVRADVRNGFAQSVSGTDLIVGPRTGAAQLLMYAVFHMGQASNNISMASVAALSRHPAVDWVVPLSMGDTHQGYPVVATTQAYFKHYRYGDQQPLQLAQGQHMQGDRQAVIGADVAARLGYVSGTTLVLTHGEGHIEEGHDHDDHPITVVGVLARTGTPVDRTIYIPLEASEALHEGWFGGMRLPGDAEHHHDHDHAEPALPREVSVAMVGLKNRAAVFAVQRWVAGQRAEPLMAVMPALTLNEIWSVVGVGEQVLLLVTALVSAVSVMGLMAVVLAGLHARRRELVILRALGAGPAYVMALLAMEGLLLTCVGLVGGWFLHLGALWGLRDWVQSQWGLNLMVGDILASQGQWTLVVLVCGLLAGLLPAIWAYRLSLHDGLSPRT